jgi:ADP-ribosyl-[dinitrogen reductase] hydrolase
MTAVPQDFRPLRIDAIAATPRPGAIGVSICPGHSGRPDIGMRDVDADIMAAAAWGAEAVVTLMEPTEFGLLGVERLPNAIARAGLGWYHLPIRDGGVPDAAFEHNWRAHADELHERLVAGRRILVHCRGGLGRSGMVAARLLVEAGAEPRAAIERVRAARPGAIENSNQESYVLALGRG